MKNIALVFVLIVTGLVLPACKFHGHGISGSGVRKSEKRDLKPFKAIDTTGAYKIDVTCQKTSSFEIEADDNLLPLIKTDVLDGILVVSSDQRINASKPVVLRVSLPELSSVTSRGAGEIKITDAAGDSLKIESTGAASVYANGKVKTVTISSTGAGEVDTTNLKAEKATVEVKGAANIDTYATEQLDVTVAGAGSVTYSGNPKVVHKSVSGFGSVNKKE